MSDTALLMPALALLGWTFLVLLCIPYRRFRAAARRQVTEADFRHGESARVPSEVSLANRNFMNLLEVPVLFYVLSLIAYVTALDWPAFLPLAWAYVALRVLHSVIHLTYNKVRHRLMAFATSSFVAMALWAGTLLNLA